MDFIDSVPHYWGKDTILVVLDHLTKDDHFMALTHPFSSLIVAQAYLDNIYKLYRLPDSIVYDRDLSNLFFLL